MEQADSCQRGGGRRAVPVTRRRTSVAMARGEGGINGVGRRLCLGDECTMQCTDDVVELYT